MPPNPHALIIDSLLNKRSIYTLNGMVYCMFQNSFYKVGSLTEETTPIKSADVILMSGSENAYHVGEIHPDHAPGRIMIYPVEHDIAPEHQEHLPDEEPLKTPVYPLFETPLDEQHPEAFSPTALESVEP